MIGFEDYELRLPRNRIYILVPIYIYGYVDWAPPPPPSIDNCPAGLTAAHDYTEASS